MLCAPVTYEKCAFHVFEEIHPVDLSRHAGLSDRYHRPGMPPPCSDPAIRVVVGLPGAAPPPHRLLYALHPTSSNALFDSVSTQFTCVIRFGGVRQGGGVHRWG